jgi:hypothetical protein
LSTCIPLTASQGKSIVTTDDWLQATINDVKRDKRRRRLTVLVSGEVDEISFDVHSCIRTLKILRCGDSDANRQLLINGSSTFGEVRLDMWQAKRRKRSIYLGLGVQIKVELNGNSSWARSTNEFDAFQQEELRRYVRSMGHISTNSAWDEWKGPVAVILGLAVGAGKFAFSMKVAAGGMYAKYKFGMLAVELGAAGAKGSVVATAAGPAILLGVGVAAAVYFIPWDSVFKWLEKVIAWLWEGMKAIWARFQSWVTSFFGNDVAEEESFMPRPMRFSG